MLNFIAIRATSAEEASKEYARRRDKSGEGASTFPNGLWNGNTITYNGVVWDGYKVDIRSTGKLYTP